MVATRSGKVLINTAVRSKGFNVRGRAADARTTNVFVSDNNIKLVLARSHNVVVVQKKVTLADAYETEKALNKGVNGTYLLIGYGEDWLYFGRTPLDMTGPRPVARSAKADRNFPAPPGTDLIEMTVEFVGPAKSGDTSKSRDSVMGDSARNYAASVYGADWANARSWEWLHIRAHSLGGDNAVGNLVAGTFDANTKMIPYEKSVHDLSQAATPQRSFKVTWLIDVFPASWVAIGIRMSIQCKDAAGQLIVQSADFNAQTDMNLDKLQYDIYGMD